MPESATRHVVSALLLALALAPQGPVFSEDPPPPGTRTVYLVRHGDYDQEDERDPDVGKGLVPLGVAQARLLGARLRAMDVEWSSLTSSTMTRARETALVLADDLPSVELEQSPLLRECLPPTRREDVMADEAPEDVAACVEQLEAAWERFMTPSPAGDRHDLLVLHGNVIRYFVTRALGVDTESWLGMSIGNCSLTEIAIAPDHSMKVLSFSDTGHIPANLQTRTAPGRPRDLSVPATTRAGGASPLAIGDTFTLESDVLGETRRVNVYEPSYYGEPIEGPMPVLYVLDGGIHEDFLHVAGLVDVSVLNGTMRPFLVVGIENTDRRRDLTGPTAEPGDLEIAPRAGGSGAFRRFLRDELMPEVRRRYDATDEAAIVGESFAGLFVVETFLREPDLFDTYVAVDPSLWWNREAPLDAAQPRLESMPAGITLYLAASSEPTILAPTSRLAEILGAHAPPGVSWHFRAMPEETHASVYHPAALAAFRKVLGQGSDD